MANKLKVVLNFLRKDWPFLQAHKSTKTQAKLSPESLGG